MDPWAVVLISDTSLLSLAMLGLLAAFVTVDESALAQTWFGQPLPVALLTGFFCGEPLTGLAIGLPLQLVLAGNLPVGQTFTGDPGVALCATVAASCLSGHEFLPALQEGEYEGLGRLGWAILAAGMLSALGHVVVQAERKANRLFMMQGRKTLRDGSLVRMEGIHLRCLATTFFRGFILVLLYLVILLKLWLPLYAHLPGQVHEALAMLPLLLPGLGLGTMVDRFGPKHSWRWLVGGFGGMMLLTWLGVV
jgi:mannose/fructose/N-acetylgalactosamine-specific phosphotransferase system component IIC